VPLIPRAIRARIARTRFAREAIAQKADLSAFRDKPTLKLVTGLVVLALSFLLGWPAVAGFGIAAIYFREPLIVAIGGPAVYGFSWLLWALSMFLLGAESYKYGRIFLRWAVRRLVEGATRS